MDFLVVLLIFFGFLQGAFTSLNLVLLILISRSLVIEEKKNYYLAFFLGLFLALLLNQPLGILSLIYLLSVKVVYMAKRLPFASHWLTVLPLSFIILMAVELFGKLIFKSDFSYWPVIIQSFLSLPIYLILRAWEERFIPKKELRLNIGK